MHESARIIINPTTGDEAGDEAATRPAPRRSWTPIAILSAVMGCVAAGVASLAGDPRLAITPDSVAYLNAADNLRRGLGLVLTITPLSSPATVIPFATWPPLYPLLISAACGLTSDTVTAARIVQIVSVGLLALPVGWLTYRMAGARFVLPVLVFCAILRPLLITSSFVWSESTFIFLSYTAIATLVEGMRDDRFQGRIRLSLLAGAGLLAGLAMLTRYIGAAVIAAGVAVIVMHAEEESSGRRAIRRLVAFTLPAVFPNILWIARTHAATGYFFGENRGEAVLEPQSVVLSTLRTFWTDAVVPPTAAADPARMILAVIGLVSFGLLVAAAIRRFGPEMFEASIARRAAVSAVAAFAILYPIAVVALSLRVPYDPINTRILAPIYPGLLALGAFLIRPTFGQEAAQQRDRFRHVVMAAGIVLLLLQGAATVRYVRGPLEDRSLTHPYWRSVLFGESRWASDPAIAGLADFAPPGTLILSNIADAVAIWTGYPTKSLPPRGNSAFVGAITRHHGAIVLVHPEHRRVVVGLEELDAMTSAGFCTYLGRRGEGVFYRVR